MSKRTGPQSTPTKLALAACEKLSRETKAPAWKRVCDELSKPTRIKRHLSMVHLNALAAKHPKKVIVVLGKVLGKEAFTEKATVYAFAYSDSAQKSIAKTGHAKSVMDLVKEKPSVKEWVMVQ